MTTTVAFLLVMLVVVVVVAGIAIRWVTNQNSERMSTVELHMEFLCDRIERLERKS